MIFSRLRRVLIGDTAGTELQVVNYSVHASCFIPLIIVLL